MTSPADAPPNARRRCMACVDHPASQCPDRRVRVTRAIVVCELPPNALTSIAKLMSAREFRLQGELLAGAKIVTWEGA